MPINVNSQLITAISCEGREIVRAHAGLDLVWEKDTGGGFPEITIGGQTWSAPIDIDDLGGGIYPCNNDEARVPVHGRLYTWAAAVRIAANLDGWHLPSYAEYQTLQSAVNSLPPLSSAAASKLAGYYDTWDSGNLRNSTAFGVSGFNQPSCGRRLADGTFLVPGRISYLWCSNNYPGNALTAQLQSISTSINFSYETMTQALSLRLIKD